MEELFVIRRETPCEWDGSHLYWSNEWGYGSLEGAERFTRKEKERNRLPHGGFWVALSTLRSKA